MHSELETVMAHFKVLCFPEGSVENAGNPITIVIVPVGDLPYTSQ
jgi:hypothetical protein